MDTARIVRNLILLTDENSMAKNKAGMEKDNAEIAERLAFISGLVGEGTESELFGKVKDSRAAYLKFSDQVVKLGLASTAVTRHESNGFG